MPPERLHSLNSQGRQKSCSECAKAKRRCDLHQPRCTRCSRQQLACIYPTSPAAAVNGELPENAVSDLTIPGDPIHFDLPDLAHNPVPGLLDFNFTSSTGFDSITPLSNTPNAALGQPMATQRPWYTSIANRKFSLSQLDSVSRARIEYPIEQLLAAPASMVLQCCTPWCHPMLYADEMPRSLQGASQINH
jgi:hypothetical protein